jgi:hypothetical protein
MVIPDWWRTESRNALSVSVPDWTTFSKGEAVEDGAMALPITLPVRTWAALDAALHFFRNGPDNLADFFPLVRDCQTLHEKLGRLGIAHSYVQIGSVALDRPELRLHVASTLNLRQALRLQFTPTEARGLALACWQVIDAQMTLLEGILLPHEVDEIQAARSFLSEVRRLECPMPFADSRGLGMLRWNDDANQYEFDTRTSHRLMTAFLHQRASLN